MVNSITEIFGNRELAFFTWFTIVFIPVLLFARSIRKSLGQILTSIFKWKILSIILGAILYSSVIVIILFLLDFWNLYLLKTTIYWFFLTSLVILYNLNDDKIDNPYKKIIVDNIQYTVFLEFIVNIHEFSYLGDLIFFPIIIILSLVSALPELRPEFKKLEGITSLILALIGITLLVLSIIDIAKSIREFANFNTLKDFLMPVILSVSFIPFVFSVELVMRFETLFVNFKIYLDNKKLIRYSRRRSILKYWYRPKKIKQMLPIVMREFYAGITKEEIKDIL